MSKIKTYKVTFLNKGKKDETEFCAYSRVEARILFKDFLVENNLPDNTVGKIEPVYNAEDHALYGEEYGYQGGV